MSCPFHIPVGSTRSNPTDHTFAPSAAELLDHVVLDEARVNPATKAMTNFIEGQPGGMLIVEFHGHDEESAAQKARDFAGAMAANHLGYAKFIRTDKQGQQHVWEVRKLGLGLISNTPGPCKGKHLLRRRVPVDDLASYIRELCQACDERQVIYSMYAHASVV